MGFLLPYTHIHAHANTFLLKAAVKNSETCGEETKTLYVDNRSGCKPAMEAHFAHNWPLATNERNCYRTNVDSGFDSERRFTRLRKGQANRWCKGRQQG